MTYPYVVKRKGIFASRYYSHITSEGVDKFFGINIIIDPRPRPRA